MQVSIVLTWYGGKAQLDSCKPLAFATWRGRIASRRLVLMMWMHQWWRRWLPSSFVTQVDRSLIINASWAEPRWRLWIALIPTSNIPNLGPTYDRRVSESILQIEKAIRWCWHTIADQQLIPCDGIESADLGDKRFKVDMVVLPGMDLKWVSSPTSGQSRPQLTDGYHALWAQILQ